MKGQFLALATLAVSLVHGATVVDFGQCGGLDTPTMECGASSYCHMWTKWFSQCLPGMDPNTTPMPTTTTMKPIPTTTTMAPMPTTTTMAPMPTTTMMNMPDTCVYMGKTYKVCKNMAVKWSYENGVCIGHILCP